MLEAPLESNKLADWLDWLEQLDPSRIELGLDRIKAVYQNLPHLFPDTKVVTVAGTNGKGSTLAALQSAALALDKKIVSFSSPHLLLYNERIQLDGKPVEDELLVSVFKQIAQAQKNTFLSYFEYGALAALLVAAEYRPDLLILEVGLGGRLDAVNMIDADIVVLTAIGLDHMDWLGSDLESIAAEKCGVLRENIPVVLAAPDIPETVYRLTEQMSAPRYAWGEDFGFTQSKGIGELRVGSQTISLAKSKLHPQSLASAAMVIEYLWPGKLQDIASALELAQLSGRYQELLLGSRQVILDVAHNPMSLAHLVQKLEEESVVEVDLVFSLMQDKDCTEAIRLLKPLTRSWKLVRLDTPRAFKPEDIAKRLREQGIDDIEILDLSDNSALNRLFVTKTEQIPLLVTGSFYTVSAILELAHNRINSGK